MNLVSSTTPAARIDFVQNVRAWFQESIAAQRVTDLQLARIRQQALDQFGSVGLPTRSVEDWKYTSLSRIEDTPWVRAKVQALSDVDRARLEAQVEVLGEADRVVLVNGFYLPELSRISSRATLAVSELVAHTARFPLSQLASIETPASSLTALNTALIESGVFIDLLEGPTSERPVAIVYATVGSSSLSFPRVFVRVAPKACHELIELFISLPSEGQPNWINGVTEIDVAAGGRIRHARVQTLQSDTILTGRVAVRQAEASGYKNVLVAIGGSLVREEITCSLEGERCESSLLGLYTPGSNQHMDFCTLLDHQQPHGQTHELYKGVLRDRGTGVFTGKIKVASIAQKTDSKQTNRALLLSPDATINTRPQLEIFADDVKCTHGATVGHLDDEALFYLRSRGLSRSAAEALLTEAFSQEVLDEIQPRQLKSSLTETLFGGRTL